VQDRGNGNSAGFTIDADGVMQDEHIGDASIEGQPRKLCAATKQRPATKVAGTAAE
jgi:hypothetical protein